MCMLFELCESFVCRLTTVIWSRVQEVSRLRLYEHALHTVGEIPQRMAMCQSGNVVKFRAPLRSLLLLPVLSGHGDKSIRSGDGQRSPFGYDTASEPPICTDLLYSSCSSMQHA